MDGGSQLHPHYRSETPLDAAILKLKAGSDEFANEKDHDQIAAVLAQWSAGLRGPTPSFHAIENALAGDFAGSMLVPAESRILRPGPALEVRQVGYAASSRVERSAFVAQLRKDLSVFSRFLTAEFQVTRIERLPSGLVRTRIRFEFVGTGPGFHREQRVGVWELDWEPSAANGFRVRRWQAEDETRSSSAGPWFADVTGHSFGRNASWTDQMTHGVDYWRTVLDGASGIDVYGHNGVAVGDIDGDGFDDVYVCQPAGLPNRLYRNLGDGTFEDFTATSGVGLLDNTACALFVDVDNDGREDLIVVRATGPLLFLNEGNGKFRGRPNAFRFAQPPQGTFTGAAAADYDRDGWLDVYFCLYTYYQGADQYKYPTPYFAAENGPPNYLMRNNRDGTFRDVTAATGLDRNNTRFSFCCAWGDANGDGWPDLYVVNDFGLKSLYRNNGDGTFTDVERQAGVEDPGAGMSVCWWDYDNDGLPDLYVANMWTAAGERISGDPMFQRDAAPQTRGLYRKHAMGNSLFRNHGDGTFGSATRFDGGGMGRWSWSSDAWDFDHDGFPDLYIANGMVSGVIREDLNSFFWRQVVSNSPNEGKASPEYEQGWNAVNELLRADYSWSGFERNVFYANNRDGTFSEVSGAVGMDFLEDGRAFALADFDQDGRQEVLLKNRSAPQLRLLKNVVRTLQPSIAFRLRGVKSSRDAIGAAITVEAGGRRQTKWVQAGSGFLSQHSKEVMFGLGQAEGTVRAAIRWPSGLVQQLDGLRPNSRIWVEEGSERPRVEPFRESRASAVEAAQASEVLPERVPTWLLVPVTAPDFAVDGSRKLSSLRGKPLLLSFQTAESPDLAGFRRVHRDWAPRGLQLLVIACGDGIPAGEFPLVQGTDDVAGVYNVLYRHLFDRRRDLTLPTSFVISEAGEIVRVIQGPLDFDRVEADVRRTPRTPAARLAAALPFAGESANYVFARNYQSLGAVYFQRGYFEQAEAFFREAVRDDPSSAEAHYGLGSAYLKQDRKAEARVSFEQAVKLQPNYPDTAPNAWNNLGLLAAREGRGDEAIACFQEALRQSPEYWVALENLGNAYRQQRRWDDAQGVLERALAARPRDPEANYSLAMVFAQKDETERAQELLERALQLRPNYPEALNNLGILYIRTRRRDEAVARFEECARVAPDFDQAYLNLARLYAAEGARDKARAALLELLKRHPDHAQARQMFDQLR